MLSRLQQMLFASTKTSNSSFVTAAILLLIGAALTFFLEIRPRETAVFSKMEPVGHATQ